MSAQCDSSSSSVDMLASPSSLSSSSAIVGAAAAHPSCSDSAAPVAVKPRRRLFKCGHCSDSWPSLEMFPMHCRRLPVAERHCTDCWLALCHRMPHPGWLAAAADGTLHLASFSDRAYMLECHLLSLPRNQRRQRRRLPSRSSSSDDKSNNSPERCGAVGGVPSLPPTSNRCPFSSFR